jgi:hypothetical protein
VLRGRWQECPKQGEEILSNTRFAPLDDRSGNADAHC